MLWNRLKVVQIPLRFASTVGGGYPGATRTALPRRPVKKIPPGRARPAIYYQFDVAVELTDGSVVMRRSQYPQEELRLIQDQRNNPYWNPSREDLVDVDPNSVGNIEKFRQRYSGMFADDGSTKEAGEGKNMESEEEVKEPIKAKQAKSVNTPPSNSRPESKSQKSAELDDFLDLLDDTKSTPTNKKK